MDWKTEMYSFPVASVSASLYLVPSGYFTASQPSVNLCWLLAASYSSMAAPRCGVAPCFILQLEQHCGAMSSRNRPSLNSNKSTDLKYHPRGGCRLGNKLSSSPCSEGTHRCKEGFLAVALPLSQGKSCIAFGGRAVLEKPVDPGSFSNCTCRAKCYRVIEAEEKLWGHKVQPLTWCRSTTKPCP